MSLGAPPFAPPLPVEEVGGNTTEARVSHISDQVLAQTPQANIDSRVSHISAQVLAQAPQANIDSRVSHIVAQALILNQEASVGFREWGPIPIA